MTVYRRAPLATLAGTNTHALPLLLAAFDQLNAGPREPMRLRDDEQAALWIDEGGEG